MTFKLPEPAVTGLLTGEDCGLIGPARYEWESSPKDYPRIDYYTEAQLLQVRRDALEECAKVCDEHLEYPSLTPKHCADAIRKLKEQT